MDKPGYVYILSSHSRVLYIGVTNNIKKRLFEHRTGVFTGFSADYNVNQLVYLEVFPGLPSAIAREKQLKGWSRKKKITLIELENPFWEDLAPSVNAG
jgi:putative endonuclease